MQAAQQEIAQLRSQVAAGQGTSGELQQARAQEAQLREQLQRVQAELHSAQAELADARNIAQQHHDAGLAANAGVSLSVP